MTKFPEHKAHDCDHAACMHNVDGKCWHSKCPIGDSDYRMPGEIATEKQLHWHETHKIDQRELRYDED